MIRLKSFLTAVLGCTLAASPLLAAPADSVRMRIAEFREIGASFKAINDAMRSPTPQTMLLQIAARQIVNSSKQIYSWFPAGSGPESGAKTRTKPEIWQQAAKFKLAQDAFGKQAMAFQRAAGMGNVAMIQAESRKLGATCKGCHDAFRTPDN